MYGVMWLRSDYQKKRFKMYHSNITLVRYAVGLWIVYHYTILAIDFSFFWGGDTFVNLENIHNVKSTFFLTLVSEKSLFWNALSIVCLFLIVIADFCGFTNILLRTLTWLLVINLDNYVYSVLNGGNNIIHIVLVFLALAPSGRKVLFTNKIIMSKLFFRHANKILLNLIRLQLCLVYLSAGLSKVTGNLWPSGTAIFYTLSNPDYSIPLIYESIGHWPPIFYVVPNYIVFLYQILFPWLCWNKFIKPYLLIVGILIHLCIGLILGLPFFAGAVIVIYSSFLDESASDKLLRVIGRFRKSFFTRLLKTRCLFEQTWKWSG